MSTSSPPTGLAGHLLCAVPQLADPNFARAVVLMISHDDQGAFGLSLTGPLPTTIREVAEVIGLRWAGDPAAPLRLGGPVEPTRGFVLHRLPAWDPHAEPVVDGLWLTTSLDGVDPQRPVGADTALLLMGYAGWGPGQLEAEMTSGSWIAVPIRPPGGAGEGVDLDWLFTADPAVLWAEALAAAGADPARFVGHRGLGKPIARA